MSTLRFGEFRLDASDERLWGPAGPVKLGNKAFRLLLYLTADAGRLVTKDELFSSVWDGTIVSESALTSVVKELRRALGDESRTPRFIESVYGRGYRFIAPLTAEEDAPRRPHAAEVGREPAPEPGLGEPPLLYVAPAEDASTCERHPFLGETLREEMLVTLSRFRDIRLVSEKAAGAVEGHGAYGERDYQLSLRLLGRGAAVRAFVRLSRLATGAIIWAETADLDARDLGEDADRLVRAVAAAALPMLQDDVLRHAPEQPGDGYSLYFRNKLQMRCQHGLEGARALAASWESLIERYPTFAAAHPPLIRLYNTDFCFTGLGSSGPNERARGYELAHRAIAIDPTDAHLHSAKGWCHLWAGEGALARSHLEEALRLNPYNQTRLLEVCTGFIFLDQLDKAEELLERSRGLTPFASDAPHEEQALLSLLRHDFGRAAQELALVRRTHPDDGMTTEPPILSELYALVAAAGAGASDLEARSRWWQARVRAQWAADAEPDADALLAWALNHNPFQVEARREWMLGLLGEALSAARPDRPRTPARERPERPSGRAGAAPAAAAPS
jgi:DNA-binding winged helix-turn-helix (wHTH) protein/tetratricopeptide (TPR) repeat protein